MPDAGGVDQINTLPRLLDYLREHCEWPIEEEDFENLVFDWDPRELGLKEADEYADLEIKQLRPLTSNQPWGIFFVNFPKKDLKVTILRRILGALTVKRRKSANKGEQAAWLKHDLLFLSSYGESGHRRLTFAHFQDDPDDPRGVARLDVLGWNQGNTIRRLSEVRHRLTDNLRWPAKAGSIEAWRTRWSGAFDERPKESINTSKQLASALAALAIEIRDRAISLLDEETDSGPLTKLYKAFKEALIHDLTPHRFADMYAQTITYGLLATTFRRPSGAVTADSISMMALPTNPFLADTLKDFLRAGGRKGGMDFDELGVNDVVEMLRRANMEAVLRDFDDRNPEEDPVIHFYESFLKEYDPEERIQRGVFYTPRPVVSFIVRSVDEILKRDFKLEDGLADTATWGEMEKRLPDLERPKGIGADEPFVRVLDPATGTGTFLVEVIDLIHQRMAEKWKAARKSKGEIEKLWNDYVPRHLLPRLYAFELMMAPYAIAHMKLGLKLYDTGYKFGSTERARIFLTNALEPSQDLDMQLSFVSEALAHEAKAANDAKIECFTVVIGNPPYAGFSINQGQFARRLVDRYRVIEGRPLGEKKSWLLNDYVKFLGLAHFVLDRGKIGVMGMITDNSYLDGPTFRGFRYGIFSEFDTSRLVDLGGKASVRNDEAGVDDNVFNIVQGVAILVASRTSTDHKAAVQSGRIVGNLKSKLGRLSSSIAQTVVHNVVVSPPLYEPFVGLSVNSAGLEYNKFASISDVFRLKSVGVQTSRDDLSIAFSRDELRSRFKDFSDLTIPTSTIRTQFFEKEQKSGRPAGDSSFWNLQGAREKLSKRPWQSDVSPITYRPFDLRWFLNSDAVTHRVRPELTDAMEIPGNIALCVIRRSEGKRDYDYVGIANTTISNHQMSLKDGTYGIPLWLAANSMGVSGHSNFEPSFIEQMRTATSLSYQAVERESLSAGNIRRSTDSGAFTELDAMCWVYAVLSAPSYRKKYVELLRLGFPRVPFPGSKELFESIVSIGARLVAAHLLDFDTLKPLLDPKNVRFAGRGTASIEKGFPKWSNGRVAINAERWFEEVPENVWSFQIGGYQVCEKWLKDRRIDKLGRALNESEILHYRRIVTAISETVDLMAEIDRVIDDHGGWPGAFKGMHDG
jgi:Type ISP C-terminal specificity domain/Eco57I restriction-modification methylase